MTDSLQLGLYATDASDALTLHITLRSPCEEHGTHYMVRQLELASLADAPDVWSWARSVLELANVDGLCCLEGWSEGTALMVTPEDAP